MIRHGTDDFIPAMGTVPALATNFGLKTMMSRLNFLQNILVGFLYFPIVEIKKIAGVVGLLLVQKCWLIE